MALVPTLTGVMASSLQVTCLLCLMLARYWQASLYNPGGFGREFRSLRLAPAVAVILLLGPSWSRRWKCRLRCSVRCAACR